MRTRRPNSLLLFSTLCSSLLLSHVGASTALAQPAVVEPPAASPQAWAGTVTVIHPLPAFTPEALTQAHERAAALARAVAGVRHVIVVRAERAQLDSWSGARTAQVIDGAITIVADPQWSLSGVLALDADPAKAPRLLVLDATGAAVPALTSADPSTDAGRKSLGEQLSRLSTPAVSTHDNVAKKDRLALEGYDPVSYFGASTPSKGDKAIGTMFRGTAYRFATSENRDAFVADPERFAPAYGGWCAYAMADGEKVEVDPKNFLIVNDRLMLFYKDAFNNTRTKWQKKEAELLPRADANWGKIVASR